MKNFLQMLMCCVSVCRIEKQARLLKKFDKFINHLLLNLASQCKFTYAAVQFGRFQVQKKAMNV